MIWINLWRKRQFAAGDEIRGVLPPSPEWNALFRGARKGRAEGQAAFSVAYGVWLCTGDVANHARQHRQRLDRRMCAIKSGGAVTPIAMNAMEPRLSRHAFFAAEADARAAKAASPHPSACGSRRSLYRWIADAQDCVTDFSGNREAGIRSKLAEKQPSLRTSRPEEIGALALWLCAPIAHNLTGASIPVDGGWTAQ